MLFILRNIIEINKIKERKDIIVHQKWILKF